MINVVVGTVLVGFESSEYIREKERKIFLIFFFIHNYVLFLFIITTVISVDTLSRVNCQ